MNNDLILKVKDAAKISGKNEDFIRAEIRKGNLPAIKRGTEWIIQKKELDKYLGIETNDEFIAKDLYITKLESQIRIYENQISMVKSYIESLMKIL